MFLQEQNNKIWINSKTSNKEKKIDLDSSIISSCDCLDQFGVLEQQVQIMIQKQNG